jgi:hypothetical protein
MSNNELHEKYHIIDNNQRFDELGREPEPLYYSRVNIVGLTVMAFVVIIAFALGFALRGCV